MTSPDDLFGQFPVADAVLSFLREPKDRRAFARTCKSVYQFRFTRPAVFCERQRHFENSVEFIFLALSKTRLTNAFRVNWIFMHTVFIVNKRWVWRNWLNDHGLRIQIRLFSDQTRSGQIASYPHPFLGFLSHFAGHFEEVHKCIASVDTLSVQTIDDFA